MLCGSLSVMIVLLFWLFLLVGVHFYVLFWWHSGIFVCPVLVVTCWRNHFFHKVAVSLVCVIVHVLLFWSYHVHSECCVYISFWMTGSYSYSEVSEMHHPLSDKCLTYIGIYISFVMAQSLWIRHNMPSDYLAAKWESKKINIHVMAIFGVWHFLDRP